MVIEHGGNTGNKIKPSCSFVNKASPVRGITRHTDGTSLSSLCLENVVQLAKHRKYNYHTVMTKTHASVY